MGILLNRDRLAYRRWVNVASNILLPGSAQFLCGRKRAGILLFAGNIFMRFAFLVAFGSPFFKTPGPAEVVQIFVWVIWLATIGDGCRKQIPKLSIRRWGTVYLVAILLILVPILVIRQFIVQPFTIPTHSMEPTLMGNHEFSGVMEKGDGFFIDKWTYRFRAPRRGEIAVFRTSGIEASKRELLHISDHENYAKRVVGLPGERVSIRPPYIYINGQELLQPKIFATISSATNGFQGFMNASGPWAGKQEVVLGPNEYFVLGDNTLNSLDSRYYGPIRREYFFGRVAWIYWPPERRRFVE